MSTQGETMIDGIIKTAEKRSLILTCIAGGLAIIFGATYATTVTVPAMIEDVTKLNWIMLLAFGPVTAIIIAYIGAALWWGVIVSAIVWGVSKVEYFSKLPDGLGSRDLSALEADALETRLTQAMKKVGDWITLPYIGQLSNIQSKNLYVFFCCTRRYFDKHIHKVAE